MVEQLQLTREAKIMEPIYRMIKVIEQGDVLKAQTLMAVVVQYISDHYIGQELTAAEVQKVIRAVLLQEEDGRYYADYIFNELQVNFAQWITLLSIDRCVTLGMLGDLADQFAQKLAGEAVVSMDGTMVLNIMEDIVKSIEDTVIYERFITNQSHYREILQGILIK